MIDQDWLAGQFDANRDRLRGVAYRMLGSRTEADDAVQEAWLRLSRTNADEIENLGGWLTTVVARVCLDQLRARKSRPEEPLDVRTPPHESEGKLDAEQEAMLADSVGLALLVVLKKLTPAERVAFVLHDMFDLPFEEIATIVGKSPMAARQLASRARRRVRGGTTTLDADIASRRQIVDAFLAASREGNMEALLRMLDPNVVFKADAAAARLGSHSEILGADAVAKSFLGRAVRARSVLIDGNVGVAVAPNGNLLLVLEVKIENDKIVEIDAVADPERLRNLDLSL